MSKKNNKKNKLTLHLIGDVVSYKMDDLMSRMDLGIIGVVLEKAQYNVTFDTTTKIDKKYIDKIVDKLKEFFKTEVYGKYSKNPEDDGIPTYFTIKDYSYKIN